jgi:hypothetical protein
MDLGRCRRAGAQRAVPGRSLLGVVNGFAGEQRSAPGRQRARRGKLDQLRDDGGVEPLAGERVAHAGALGAQHRPT